MLLWVLFAVLTSCVLVFILAPLMKRAEHGASAGEADVAVYKSQLSEIDTDLQRGLLSEQEAEGARIEVTRRLLAVHTANAGSGRGQDADGDAAARWRTVSIAVAAAVPAAALALYLSYGSPGQGASPHAARMKAPIGKQRIADLIGRVEARLRDHPEDGTGWDVLAPVYMRQRRFGEAADAFARAIRLLGESPARLSGLARASVFANNGIVGETARKAWQKVLAGAPNDNEARFWLAVGREQDGDQSGAKAAYLSLLKRAPADAPWRRVVVARLKGLSVTVPAAPVAPPVSAKPPERGPTQADIRAAGKMSPEDRQRMIEGMVAGLASRLKKNGKDTAGWLRLINSYVVLGRKDRAVAAIADARAALADDPAALQKIAAQEQALGLKTQ